MVEKRHKRSRACKHQRQYRSNAQLYPKKIACQRISETIPLNNQFRKSNEAKAPEEKKSAGDSNRARMITDPNDKMKLAVWPAMAAPAPRTAVRRIPSLVSIGLKVPLDWKGFNCLLSISRRQRTAA
jgi:hypothetical protein